MVKATWQESSDLIYTGVSIAENVFLTLHKSKQLTFKNNYEMKTTSKLIIALAFLAGATVANAQFKAGLRIGGNLSNVITDNNYWKEERMKESD